MAGGDYEKKRGGERGKADEEKNAGRGKTARGKDPKGNCVKKKNEWRSKEKCAATKKKWGGCGPGTRAASPRRRSAVEGAGADGSAA